MAVNDASIVYWQDVLALRKMPTQAELQSEAKRLAARDVIDVLEEISALLNTHLDRQTLSLCVSMIENGVNPEALATVVKELRKESEDARMKLESPER